MNIEISETQINQINELVIIQMQKLQQLSYHLKQEFERNIQENKGAKNEKEDTDQSDGSACVDSDSSSS